MFTRKRIDGIIKEADEANSLRQELAKENDVAATLMEDIQASLRLTIQKQPVPFTSLPIFLYL